MKETNEYNVRAVERALQIMDCFSTDHPERGISEIAQHVGLHKATTHRIVTTLVNFGYLERSSDDQKYKLGMRLANLGNKVIKHIEIRDEALPIMNGLVGKLDEACDLSIFDRGDVYYVVVIKSTHALSIAAAVGQRLPPYCTASGKMLLAYLSPEELDGYIKLPIKSFTEKTVTQPDELRRQLALFRQQGYAYDDEEYEVGIRAVAVPIFNHQEKVVAALGIPSPTSRMTSERIPEIARILKEAGEEISHKLGWRID
jgi:DNA-binding IclR family transcriptional regulator